MSQPTDVTQPITDAQLLPVTQTIEVTSPEGDDSVNLLSQTSTTEPPVSVSAADMKKLQAIVLVLQKYMPTNPE